MLVWLAFSSNLHEAAAQAQAYRWAKPFEVSSTAPFSWFPDIAVSPQGIVHIIWASGDPDSSEPLDGSKAIDLLRYRELSDGMWSEVNDILFAGVGGYTVRNSIAVGRDGRLYVLVRMWTEISIISAPSDNAWSARSWSKPQSVTPPVAYYTATAIDSQNVIHAFWSEGVFDNEGPENSCLHCSDLYYRSSNDGGHTWSAMLNLSTTPEGENRPQVMIDGSDRIHAVWDRGVDWYAGAGTPKAGVYRRSDDGGNSWTQPATFTVSGKPVQQTSLAVDGSGNPMVVFRGVDDDGLYFQRSLDGGNTWGPVGQIPGVRARNRNDNNLDTYALAFDSAGRAHLLMSGFFAGDSAQGSNPWLLHLIWAEGQWSRPSVVMDGELYPEWPQMVVAQGNQLHAVWFTRHASDLFGSDQGAHYQVWYSTLSTDAPATAAPPTFTPVPTPQSVPSPSPMLAPTATPLPATAQQAPALDGAPGWELRGLRTIGIALAPIVGLLALVALLTRLRRR